MFVSRLSVNEFVLADKLQVYGSAAGTVVYHAKEDELSETSRVLKGATQQRSRIMRSAWTCLSENAARQGAKGVIGVQVTHRQLEKDIFEYTVTGTAVTSEAKPSGRPFVCTLSAQEYTLLLCGGYEPVGVAFGISVYFQRFHERVQSKISKKVNAERSDFTRGIYTARQHAFTSLHKAANELKAEGVLAIKVIPKRTLIRQASFSQGMLIEMTAFGIAVVARPGTEMRTHPVVTLL